MRVTPTPVTMDPINAPPNFTKLHTFAQNYKQTIKAFVHKNINKMKAFACKCKQELDQMKTNLIVFLS